MPQDISAVRPTNGHYLYLLLLSHLSNHNTGSLVGLTHVAGPYRCCFARKQAERWLTLFQFAKCWVCSVFYFSVFRLIVGVCTLYLKMILENFSPLCCCWYYTFTHHVRRRSWKWFCTTRRHALDLTSVLVVKLKLLHPEYFFPFRFS